MEQVRKGKYTPKAGRLYSSLYRAVFEPPINIDTNETVEALYATTLLEFIRTARRLAGEADFSISYRGFDDRCKNLISHTLNSK